MTGDEDVPIAVADPFARRLMAQYLERREQDFRRLGEALATGDFPAIRLIGHKLYGSGAAYGLDEVTRLGGALEEAATAKDPAQVIDLVEQLESYVRHLKLS